MNKKKSTVLIVVLIVSLCFNLFFIGGYARTRAILKHLQTPEGRVELAAKRLELSAEQQTEITALAAQLKDEGDRMKDQHREQIETFWAEMLREKPDPGTIRSSLEQAAGVHQKSQALKVDYLLKILKELTPGQRKQYVKMIRKKNLFAE